MKGLASAFGLLVLSVVIGCNGAGGPSPTPDGSVPTHIPDGGMASCADAGTGTFFPCDVERVIAVKCRRCHDHPAVLAGCLAQKSCYQAPFPLVTWSDTRRALGDKRVVDYLAGVIERDEMPFKTESIQPPVEPLTADEKSTILAWARACAPAAAMGCPSTP
jgi:hypothetical protein